MDLVHKDKIQTGLVLRGIDLRGQTKMDRVLRDQTMVRVQIMVRVLKGIDHKDQIKTVLVQIMMLDLRDLIRMDLVLKMETTHKKKTSKFRGLFFEFSGIIFQVLGW
jgi:hypothetical protein